MVSQGLEVSTHKGIKTVFGLNFISTGKFAPKYGRIYQQLFENRQSGDYEDFVYCDKELFDTLRPQAEEFVNTISSFVEVKEKDDSEGQTCGVFDLHIANFGK